MSTISPVTVRRTAPGLGWPAEASEPVDGRGGGPSGSGGSRGTGRSGLGWPDDSREVIDLTATAADAPTQHAADPAVPVLPDRPGDDVSRETTTDVSRE